MEYFYNSYSTNYCFYAGEMHTKEADNYKKSDNCEIRMNSACFANYFRTLGAKSEEEISTDTIEFFIINTPNYGTGVSNSTSCTKEDIIWYMDYIKNNIIKDIKYELNDPILYPELNIKNTPSYRIRVTVEGNRNIKKHLCILVRLLYEFPMNYCLKEAILIMNNYNLDPKINVLDLVHLCWVTNFGNTGTLHYIGNTRSCTASKINLELFSEYLNKDFQIFDVFNRSIDKSYEFDYQEIDPERYKELANELRPDIINIQSVNHMKIPDKFLFQPFEEEGTDEPEYLHDYTGLHLRYELIYKPLLDKII